MLVQSEKEDEKDIVKKILKNHGLDYIVCNSVIGYLFKNLEIQKKKYTN